MATLRFGRTQVQITNPDRILFPRSKITKKNLVDYYQHIAPYMLSYLKNHPITMHRYPEGIKHEGFYQKNASEYFPAWIETVAIQKASGEPVHYVIIKNAATLVYLANQACITPHMWLSKKDKINIPDRMIFDFDPSHAAINFHDLAQNALMLKELLADIGLPAFVMITGSRGLHVYVPLKRLASFDVVRAFSQKIGTYMVSKNPKVLTMEIRKNKRRKKIFIDTLRNSFGATAVVPYAVRAHEGAPVATPLHWHELSAKKLTAQAYTIKNIFKRLDSIDDPWDTMFEQASSLGKAEKKLHEIMQE